MKGLFRRDFLRLAGATSTVTVLGLASGPAIAGPGEKTLRMAWTGASQILDPAAQNLLDEFQFTRLVYETLTEFDENLVPKPLLARSWSTSEDGLVWTFDLVEGATFHSGKPFGASDVVYTFERLTNPEEALNGTSFFDAVAGVKALDAHQVEFTLKYPYADFLTALAINYGSIVPEGATAESLASAPDGTGPFLLEQMIPGSVIVYRANKSYRNPEAVGLDVIRQETVAQGNSQVSLLRGGQVDMIPSVAPQFVPVLENSPGVDVVRSNGAGFHSIYINTSDARFSDARVRDAMRLVMDREALAQIAYSGLAMAKPDNVILSSNPYYDADLPIPAIDVDKAKALMAEAGYPDGFEANIYTTNDRHGLQPMTVAYAAMLEQIGIRLSIVTWSNGDLGTQGYRKKELVTFFWGLQLGADASIAPFYESNGSFNGGASEPPYFSDPEIDALILAGKTELDPEKRAEIYTKLQELTARRGYILVPYETPLVVALSDKVRGFHPFPRGFHDFKYVTLV